MQEMAAPELQPLALEAKSDAAILKYLPLPAELVGGVVDTLAQAAAAELWPTRAAALAFSQARFAAHSCQCVVPPCPPPPHTHLGAYSYRYMEKEERGLGKGPHWTDARSCRWC